MTAPFVASIRARAETLHLGDNGDAGWAVRVQVPDIWDVVRVQAPPTATVRSVKDAALAELIPGQPSDAFVTKLNGVEVLDEQRSLADAGAANGSTLLVMYRRRRAVR